MKIRKLVQLFPGGTVAMNFWIPGIATVLIVFALCMSGYVGMAGLDPSRNDTSLLPPLEDSGEGDNSVDEGIGDDDGPHEVDNGDVEPGNSEPESEGEQNCRRPDIKIPNIPVRSVPAAGKKVALTFDDGPCSEFTLSYLQVLEEHNVKATFFVIGLEGAKNPELVKAIHDEGHELGNHSYWHRPMRQLKSSEIIEELEMNNELLEEITGCAPFYFRPPFGRMDNTLLDTVKEMNLVTVTWNVDPKDWAEPGKQKIVERVLKSVEEGSIIILHEGYEDTLKALPSIIAGLWEKGYDIVTLSEMMEYWDD